jgi:hypothetical protein
VVKGAARSVAPDPSGVSGGNNSTVAAAVPTISSGTVAVSINEGGNEATIASSKTLEKPVAMSVNEGGKEATIASRKTLGKPVAMRLTKAVKKLLLQAARLWGSQLP